MTDTVTPSEGTGTAPATPDSGAGAETITDEASAIASISKRLEGVPQEAPPKRKATQPDAANDEAEQEEGSDEPDSDDAKGEPDGKEKSDAEDTDKAEGDDADDIELPDTLNGLAEALGVDPGDLAGKLRVPIKVNGKVREVTIAEAIKGHQLEADYRQKTAEVAEQKRAAEAIVKQSQDTWQQRIQQADHLISILSQQLDQGPTQADLDRLIDTDPQAYLRETAKLQARQQALYQASQARQQHIAEQQAAYSKKAAEFRKEQQSELVSKLPDLKDKAQRAKFEADMSSYLQSKGMSAEEIGGWIGGTFDHRQVLIVADAMKWRAQQEGKQALTKKLKALPKVQKPGSPKDGDERKSDARNALRDRLRRSKSTDAAVDWVKNLL